jgi:type VI secretion system protein ImpK
MNRSGRRLCAGPGPAYHDAMRDDIANLVNPVLTHALNLKDRLNRGEHPNLPTEQAALKGLLGSATQASPWGSDGAPANLSTGGGRVGFLGIRYALTCWLDEIFVVSSWGAEWNEQKLEQALYHSNLRYEKFWEQARLAESQPGSDAHESFLLCVLLGFRGKLGEDANQLRQWVETARTRIGRTQGAAAPAVPEGAMEPNVPVLPWIDRYQQMVKICSIGLLCLVPIFAFLLVKLWT